MTECQVRLHRDALSTPWGFRLQGGKDFNTPLTIQRVFAGSPADGELHRGDIILAIDNYDATQHTHKHAQDLIKKSGGSVSIRIKRSAKVGPEFFSAPQSPALGSHSIQPFVNPAPVPASHPKPHPKPMSGGFQGYGVDYNRPHAPQHRPGQVHYGGSPGGPDHSMLNRVNQTLSEVVWQPQQPQQQSYQPQFQQVPRQSTHKAPGRWHKPDPDSTGVPSGLSEPGWTPKAMHNRKVSAPPTYNPPSQPSYNQDHYDHRPVNYERPVNQPPSRPAWAGTLKSSGAPKPWEIIEGQTISQGPPEQEPVYQRQHSGGPQQYANHEPVVPHQPKVQSMHYGPSGQTYEQHSPDQYQSDTAQVTHSQYNTPIGLYSQQNVKEALDAQTSGKPGQGTLQVSSTGPDGKKTFNPAQSDVYRLLMEEEGGKRPPRGHGLAPQQQQQQHHQPAQSARYEDHNPGQEMQYHGYQDHSQQSRSMHNLEYNMSHGNEEYGTSDF